MTPADGENGIGLDDTEIRALALHVVANHLDDSDDWLLWEDVPGLGEYTFTRLDQAVRSIAEELRVKVRLLERHYDIDARHLLEQAQR